MPVIVEAHATVPSVLGTVVYLWTACLAVVAFLEELLHSGLGAAMGYALGVGLLGGSLGFLLRGHARRLREGRGFSWLRWTTGLMTPAALRSRRVQLHFGRMGLGALARELRRRGEMSLPELAEFLGCTPAEAAELVGCLVTWGEVEAVFDRVESRLVRRELYRDLAGRRACPACGGIMGVVGGRVTCHYCGRGPAD